MIEKMLNQLTLGVSLKDEATFENFHAAKNQLGVAELKKSASGNGEKIIYFWGSSGDGCTHLLQATCHLANQNNLRAVYLPLANIQDFSPAIFEGLETLDIICIDDFQKLAGQPVWEEAFFHAFNRIKDAGGHIIIASNAAPKALGLSMPDVLSRITWGMVFQLQSLTDDEKLQVLVMRAERRGMTLLDEVGKFILTHCPRHMSTLFSALDTLDKVSLAAQRKLTIPFVKSVLQI